VPVPANSVAVRPFGPDDAARAADGGLARRVAAAGQLRAPRARGSVAADLATAADPAPAGEGGAGAKGSQGHARTGRIPPAGGPPAGGRALEAAGRAERGGGAGGAELADGTFVPPELWGEALRPGAEARAAAQQHGHARPDGRLPLRRPPALQLRCRAPGLRAWVRALRTRPRRVPPRRAGGGRLSGRRVRAGRTGAQLAPPPPPSYPFPYCTPYCSLHSAPSPPPQPRLA
jgi:hypothetical protein